jgi:endonuclease/exonuclease/phosphatase family metal-dependent hydrolase
MQEAFLTVSALAFNAHLFGRTAEFFVDGNRRETGFYFRDADRLPQIISGLRRTNADLVGLTEIWDVRAQREIESSLADLYPYAVSSPTAPGLGPVIEKTYRDWPRIARRLFGAGREIGDDGYVSVFTSRHYGAAKGGLVTGSRSYFSEDQIGRVLSTILRSGPVWGGGLLFLSKFPILSSFFLEHRIRADWERLAAKGVLWTMIELPDGRRIRASLGHYQEGASPAAMAARHDQIRKTKRTLDFLGEGPVLSMCDFNVEGETVEHAWMMSTLQLMDGGAEATYRDPNPYQKKLKAPMSVRSQERRLDYVLHSDHWTLLNSRVLRREFRAADGDHQLSDHDPVLAELTLGK